MIKNFVSIEKRRLSSFLKKPPFFVNNIYILKLLFFFVLVIEAERQLGALAEVVLDVDVDGLLIRRGGGVVEPEHLPFERVAVVGQEHRTVVHAQLTFAVGLEVADRVPRLVVAACAFEFAPYFGGFAPHDSLLHGHRFHRERICLLNIHLVVAGGEQTGYHADEKGKSPSYKADSFRHNLFVIDLLFVTFSLNFFCKCSFRSLLPA